MAWWPTASIGAIAAKWKCGPRLAIASSVRKSGTCSPRAGALRVQRGQSHFRCAKSGQSPRENRDGPLRSAVWFPLHAKGCPADYVCTPAPIHNPDGSESLWCYTRPPELYGALRDQLGHFPLRNFWGPLAGIQASRWISDSAVLAARQWRPDFFYIYLPHLDYAAQRNGPDSVEADIAVAELDELIGQLSAGMREAYAEDLLWLVAGEYAITPVDHACYPNRVLRQAGLLNVRQEADGEYLDLETSQAWALVDHQFSHVFVAGGDRALAARVADLFRREPGIAEVLLGDQLARYGLDHPRSGEVILISQPRSWQAYNWWLADDRARRWPARSTFTASPATTRWSSASIRSRRASRWTPGGSRAPTAHLRGSGRSTACWWPRNRSTCPASRWPTPTCSTRSYGTSA